jgi:hypothetical protein
MAILLFGFIFTNFSVLCGFSAVYTFMRSVRVLSWSENILFMGIALISLLNFLGWLLVFHTLNIFRK